jgi:heptosyltransferase-3
VIGESRAAREGPGQGEGNHSITESLNHHMPHSAAPLTHPLKPQSILVVVTRRIGDVLLATPLIRSLKHAWPTAQVDALVFEGTQDVLAANPDVRRVFTIAERPGLLQHVSFLLRLARRYDMALSLVPGDRPTLYAYLAGRWRAGLLLPTQKESWKRRFLHRWVAFDERDTHTVLMHLALADALGIPAQREVAVTWSAEDARQLDALLGPGGGPMAVLHPSPKFNYKMWRAESWVELANWLHAHGYRLAISGGPDGAERAYVDGLVRAMPAGTLNLAGKLALGGTACLLARAAVYVGPDTAVTHMAAAVGVPTVALYGPTDPVKWGPWPRGYAGSGNPWRRSGSQRSGNVFLLQGAGACVPCRLEGCDRHLASFSDCLRQLTAAQVVTAIESVTSVQ